MTFSHSIRTLRTTIPKAVSASSGPSRQLRQPLSLRRLAREISSSSARRDDLPLPALVGSREVIERKKKEFEEKYGDRLKQKAKEKGLESIEELKKHSLANRKAEVINIPKSKINDPKTSQQSPSKTGSTSSPVSGSAKSSSSKSPIKPLSSILSPSSLLPPAPPVTSSALSQIWNTYHSTKSLKLSAVIPVETYIEVSEEARRYSSFVVPLVRGEEGIEMHFLQWAFLPHEPSLTLPPAVEQPVPLASYSIKPSTVLFTPLDQYKLHQNFAQPHLILTHYVDLAPSHGVVLMVGDITPSPSDAEKGIMSSQFAQMLVWRLQQFYGARSGKIGEKSGVEKVGEREKREERSRLLRLFHEEPEKFEVERLIQLGKEL